MSRPPPELAVKKKKVVAGERIKIARPGLKYQQNIFVKYIVNGYPVEEVAERMNIPLARCRIWLRNKRVTKVIEEKLQFRIDLDAKKRKGRTERVSSAVYLALIDKIAKGSLDRMNTKNLTKLMIELNKEIRADTPGDNVKQVQLTVGLTEELAERYRKANSSKYDEEKAIIEMSIPKKQLEASQTEKIDGQLQQEISEAQYEQINGDGGSTGRRNHD